MERKSRNVHRVSLGDSNDVPLGWTADSRDIVILSNRAGDNGVYRQNVDGSPAQLIFAPPNFNIAQTVVSSDGKWLIFSESPGEVLFPRKSARFYRVPIGGGTPEFLFEVSRPEAAQCTNRTANFCVFGSNSDDGRQMLLMRFDPASGNRKELLRVPTEPGHRAQWGISPDGSIVAVIKSDFTMNQLSFISVADSRTRDFKIEGYDQLNSICPAPRPRSIRSLSVAS